MTSAVSAAVRRQVAERAGYHNNASVEVRLFADRLEVWNPGTLPGTLTLDDLRTDHASVPNNPLMAESLYLTRYVEKVGPGTQKMIALCRESGLPEPDFEQRHGSFVVTLWRDWLTPEALAELKLNDWQSKAIASCRLQRRLTNREYQQITGATRPTAKRDLEDMVSKGILIRKAEAGEPTTNCPKNGS